MSMINEERIKSRLEDHRREFRRILESLINLLIKEANISIKGDEIRDLSNGMSILVMSSVLLTLLKVLGISFEPNISGTLVEYFQKSVNEACFLILMENFGKKSPNGRCIGYVA